ncbi:hypothetical protein MKW98_025078 [Papaver atlanticum]|uniref:Uncharacterized protein n=1 Tax=Papaver atlanticum TaxID=357466 RepID=A0AAD4S1W6_9MAGN|nr:hypothetical protein MKW98_025078 [Papaver atlanticum]
MKWYIGNEWYKSSLLCLWKQIMARAVEVSLWKSRMLVFDFIADGFFVLSFVCVCHPNKKKISHLKKGTVWRDVYKQGKYEETMRLIDLMEKRVVMEESILEVLELTSQSVLRILLLSILQGRNVVIEQSFGAAKVIKDSVIVAESIEFKDKVIDIVASLVKQAANATNNVAGDGDQQELVFSSTSAEANAAVAVPHVTVKLGRPKASMLTNTTFTLQRKALFSRAWLLLKVFHHMICPNIKCKSIQVASSKNLGLLMYGLPRMA